MPEGMHTFTVGMRPITLPTLSPELNRAIVTLHETFYGLLSIDWATISQQSDPYFDNHHGNWGAHNSYFENFTVIWQDLLKSERYREAERLWEKAIEIALAWESRNPARRIHKGTPYYFWAETALRRGDLDQGYLLIHRAVDEDRLTLGELNPSTPGYALITLNERPDQRFLEWVVDHANFFRKRLENYRTTHNSKLTLEDVRSCFLDQPPVIEVVFLLTYTIARLRNLEKLRPHVSEKNSFAGQVQLNLLFDIALVIEIAVKHKNPALSEGFMHQAEFLSIKAGCTMSNPQIGEINRRRKDNPAQTFEEARRGTLVLDDGLHLDRRQADIAVSYLIRNQAGHEAKAPQTISGHFDDIQNALFRVLAMAIEYLY